MCAKGEITFFSKNITIIVLVIAITLTSFYFFSYYSSILKYKKASEFRNEVMNSLLKIVSKDCLGANLETSSFFVLNISKIDEFEKKYENIEPECERPIEFDYGIKIVQFEKFFKAYPGKIYTEGELTYSNEFSSHPIGGNYVPYFDCNFDPQEHPELCRQTELDRIVCSGCIENPRENCPYEKVKRICCIYYICPRDACEEVEIKKGAGDCSGGCIVARNCNLSKCEWYPWHGACGMTYTYKEVEIGKLVSINTSIKTWGIGFSAGMNVFSPEIARKNEITISIPIIIWYNETYHPEGMLYLHAVRGELELIYGIIQHICDEVKKGEKKEIKRKIEISAPIRLEGNKICMLNNCKKLDCKVGVKLPVLEKGEYYLTFRYNKNKNIIEVIK